MPISTAQAVPTETQLVPLLHAANGTETRMDYSKLKSLMESRRSTSNKQASGGGS